MKLSLFILLVFFSNALVAGNNDPSKEKFEKLYQEGVFLEAMQEGHVLLGNYDKSNLIDYAQFLDKLAECEYELEEYTDAMNHLKESLKLKKAVCGKKSVEYAMTLHHIANCQSYMNNDHADRYERKAFETVKEITKEWSDTYIEFLLYYLDYLDPEEAFEIVKGFIQMIDSDTKEYLHAIEIIASYYWNLSDYKKAIEYNEKAVELGKNILGEKHPFYANELCNLANCYWVLVFYQKSLDLYEKAHDICVQSCGRSNIRSLNVLSSIARTKADMGDRYEGEALLTEALFMSKNRYGDKSYEYATFLSLFSYIKLEHNELKTACKLITESNNILKKIEGESGYNYLNNLHNLSIVLSYLGDDEEALKMINKAILGTKKIYGVDHIQYKRCILQKCAIMQDPHEAINLINKEIIPFDYLYDGKFIADAYGVLSEKYLGINADSCIHYQQKSLDLYAQLLGKNSDKYIAHTGALAEYLHFYQMYERSSQKYQDYFLLRKQALINDLISMGNKQRKDYRNFYDDVFDIEIPKVAYTLMTDSSFMKMFYDFLLMKKGLLLNTEIALKDLLIDQNDSTIIRLYDDLELISRLENSSWEAGVTTSVEERIKTEEKLNRIDVELMKKSSAYNQLKSRLLVSCDDVREKLQDNEIAIEFETIPINKDSIVYAALTLRKSQNEPKLIPLFEEKELKALSPSRLYNTLELSNILWKPLNDDLTDVETIYFSPIGELYNINIECLPFYGGEGPISDHFNIYRLSSTRELAINTVESDGNKAIIYGGLSYDMSIKDMEDNAIKYKGLTRGNTITPYIDSLIIRKDNPITALQYLPGTRDEAESVSKILNVDNYGTISAIKYVGVDGTEASFKSLSGKRIKIIHIATHGFYHNEHNYFSQLKKNKLLLSEYKLIADEEEKMLTRSGLYFAGANHIRMGEILTEGMDDGILTAREIAEVDLRGLDLVVLSACQTALGDISGDGVFGLQRGFKKAGANSILMSLWHVDDNVTKLLMEQFYINYLSGMSKQDSLKQAQRYVREYEIEGGFRPYDNPYYWASFIMLDGLNENAN